LDLSLGGVAFLIGPEAHLSANEALTLIATDSYGKSYELPVVIKRLTARKAGTLVGCTFDLTDKHVHRKIIGFVFGDSRRWKYFFERQPRDTVNSVSGFFYLVKIGLKGAARSFIGMGRLAWRIGFE
jgi:hypothetical protein